MRLGLFLHTLSGGKIYLIATLILVLLHTANTYAQISPGPLTKFHANLEGLKNCTACHVLGDKVTNDKCLDCHKEIKSLIENNTGYHAGNEVRNKECRKCHSEHNGRDFQIVRFDENKFDHSTTGFMLVGKHSQIKCMECHQSKFIRDSDLKKRRNTFLGLGANCTNCHEDVHQKMLGNSCNNCHNFNSFKPATKFDHNTAKFKLTGLHQTTDCVKCHKIETRNGKSFQNFVGLAYNSCASCHVDVHKGKFGKTCESCHNTTGFKNIKAASFDHNKTNFPLVGRHQIVKCADCHGINLASKPKYALCTDCHKDYHNGQFTQNKIVRDCSLCHNVYGFSPSTFTIEKHNTTKFVLAGSHLAVSCKGCHKPGTEEWNFVFGSEKCNACHKNIHGNEISFTFLGNNECENCHSVESWNKINFDHSKTKFTLEGKHKSVECISCHAYKNSQDKIEYKFASLNSRCESCHNDIHQGQFNISGQSDCSNCHLFDNWTNLKFDHEKTKFSLKGAHSRLKCIQCHKPVNENGVLFIKYKLEEIKCADCHTS
jgi:nitrate/TMAO reductase-like tetraheme cytochrome c subunit